MEQVCDERGVVSNSITKLCADLEHLKAGCLNDVNVAAAALGCDEQLARLPDDELIAEEGARGTSLEQMGPVNIMALDEYKETAQRHAFLEVQREELINSIENTQESIREIEHFSRARFEEALARVNENFALVFADLFNGGRPFGCYVVWDDGEFFLREYEYPIDDTIREIRKMPILKEDQKALIAVLKSGEMPSQSHLLRSFRNYQE